MTTGMSNNKKVSLTKEDYLWFYHKFRKVDCVPIDAKSAPCDEWVRLNVLSQAGLLRGEGSSFLLTDQGFPIINKLREREALLLQGAPFSIKRMVTPYLDAARFGPWCRFKWSKYSTRWIIFSPHAIVAGKSLSTGFINADVKILNIKPGKELTSPVRDIIDTIPSLLSEEIVLLPYKYQRKTLGGIGYFWFVSGDGLIQLPLHEIYYDVLTNLSNRASNSYKVTTINYADKPLLIFKNADAPRSLRVVGEVVGVFTPLKRKENHEEMRD